MTYPLIIYGLRHLMLAVAVLVMSASVQAKGPSCKSSFINPFTDICWSCMLPITLGSIPVAPSSYPDTLNPTSPISFCPKPPPILLPGLNIGFWEPYNLVDVTRVPWCMVSMGFQIPGLNQQQVGGGKNSLDDGNDSGFYHAHWYKYPLLYWLQLIESVACLSVDNFDIGYMTEIDPLWDDDELAFFLNPEAILFGNSVAQLACVAESVATSTNKALPFDPLFWCMGSQGSAYPLTGNTGYRDTPVQAATLIMERLNYKLHRQGLVWETRGVDGAVCYQWPTPILPKSRYRYQMSRMIPDSASCHPYGTTTAIWETGHDNPVTGENFGFVNFRKRNCVFL